MKRYLLIPYVIIVLLFSVYLINGCNSVQNKSALSIPSSYTSPYNIHLSPALIGRILSLDPYNISENDIKKTLSYAPAPRIINLNGSIPIVTLDSLSRFLIAMGYPEESVRNPINGKYSYSSYISSDKLAGMIAWYYEKEGMMPILIGYSQGGMKVIKTLYEFSGEFHKKLSVFNPFTDKYEQRYTIHDPLTGKERSVIGLKVGYASAIATGRFMRILLGQWDMIGRLRRIPDTVKEFTGFYIKYDFLGSDLLGLGKASRYYSAGSAIVYNVELPPRNTHFNVILIEDLAKNDKIHTWINSYSPAQRKNKLLYNMSNILLAAELWYYIKKYWCIELQQLVRSRWIKKAN